MGVIHSTIGFQKSGLKGIQSNQNDWSRYLVHFTTAHAMKNLKGYPLVNMYSPEDLYNELKKADKESFDTVKKIQKSMELRPSSPSKKDSIQECICFSECNLSGLINHSERYGRFGFVFSKETIFSLGGRPTMYVDNDIYSIFASEFKNSSDEIKRRIFSLANVYTPSGEGKVQDFTHEREWRLFSSLSLTKYVPEVVFCPSEYYDQISPLFNSITIPLDILEQWGL